MEERIELALNFIFNSKIFDLIYYIITLTKIQPLVSHQN